MNFKPTKDKVLTSVVLSLVLGLPSLIAVRPGFSWDFSGLWIPLVYFIVIFILTYFVFSLLQKKK